MTREDPNLVEYESTGQITTGDQPNVSDQPLTWTERARLASQGAAFNFSDEIIGLIRGVTSGELTIEQAIEEERKLLEIAQSKPGSLKYEIGGAVLPGLLAIPLTGGASLPATIARGAAIGAGQATTAAIGAEEGGIERVTENPATLAGSAVLGGVAGPLGQKAVKVAPSLLAPVSAPVRRLQTFLAERFSGKLPSHVEAEILRIIDEGGMTVDEVISRVRQGEIIPDMSAQARNAVRALSAKGGRGAQVIDDTLSGRAERLRGEAVSTLRKDLAPDALTPNVTRSINESIEELSQAESAAYTKIFKEAGVITEELNDAIEEIININPALRKEITQHVQLAQLDPLFKVVKGQAQMLRTADLETAEILRRALMDGTKQGGSKGNLFRNLERQLRTKIDSFSPELKATRASWRQMMDTKDAFEEGRRILGKQIDDAEIYIEDLIASGNEEVIAAFRAGFASQLRQKSTTGAKITLFKNLNDLDKKDRLILEKLYPGDLLEDALQKIKLADQSAQTAANILGRSPTAITAENVKRIGSASNLANIAQFFATGNPMAIVRVVRDYLGSASNKLSDGQLLRVAQTLVSEDPNVIRRALKNPAAREALAASISNISNRIVAGGATSSAISTAGIAQEIGALEDLDQSQAVAEISAAIEGLVNSVSTAGKAKLGNLQQ